MSHPFGFVFSTLPRPSQVRAISNSSQLKGPPTIFRNKTCPFAPRPTIVFLPSRQFPQSRMRVNQVNLVHFLQFLVPCPPGQTQSVSCTGISPARASPLSGSVCPLDCHSQHIFLEFRAPESSRSAAMEFEEDEILSFFRQETQMVVVYSVFYGLVFLVGSFPLF